MTAPTSRIRIKYTGGEGIFPFTNDTTLHQLTTFIQSKSSISVTQQKLLSGYPPRPLPSSPASTRLSSLGIRNGDIITVQTTTTPAEATQQIPTPVASTSANATSSSSSSSSNHISTCTSSSSSLTPLIRRHIPDDNSCLFNAIGYCMERSLETAATLREIVAGIVASQPDVYTEAFLGGMSNQAYVEYIMTPEKWGGGIELSILSDYYETQIAAMDVETGHCYLYGELKPYSNRMYLAYTGIHYDALVENATSDPKHDRTLFPSHDDTIRTRADMTIQQLKKDKQFTNVHKFSLRCEICHVGLVGAVEARDHAQQTKHTSFIEYK